MAGNKCAGEGPSNQPPAFRRRHGDDEASSAPPHSPPSSSSNPFDDLDEGTRNLIRNLYREKDEAQNNYAKETKKTSQLEAQLAVAEDMALTAHAQLTAADARVAALESQLQILLDAAATAAAAVNARGDTIAAHLQDVPNRIREVTGHGVHQGAAVALAMVQTLSGNNHRTLHLIFPVGEAGEDFEELVDDLGVVVTAIDVDVSLDAVVSNVLANE